MFVEPVTVVSSGLPGANKSTFNMIDDDAREMFPAASRALAEMRWVVDVKAVVGVKLHTPSDPAVVVPSAVGPS